MSTARLIADRCPGCGARTASGFCEGCRNDLLRVENPCSTCGLGRPVATCPRKVVRWHLDRVVSLYDYVEPVRSHIQRLKFAGERRLGRVFGELLAAALLAMPETARVDTIVAVPIHRRRLLERGYNQAIELARPIAATLGIPLARAGIRRPRPTAAQSRLSAHARYANLRDAFEVTRDIRGRHIGVVDDVLTTGATLNALAVALKDAGAEHVDGWTISRSR